MIMEKKSIKHNYGNCSCGKFHPRPNIAQTTSKSKNNPYEIPIAKSRTVVVPRELPIGWMRTWATWFIEAFAFSVVFGIITQNSVPSALGSAFVSYFAFVIARKVLLRFARREK